MNQPTITYSTDNKISATLKQIHYLNTNKVKRPRIQREMTEAERYSQGVSEAIKQFRASN